MEQILENKEFLQRTFDDSPDATFQIPIVVHIIHKGESIGTGSNLSNDRILDQIDRLNDDFRRTNEDAVNTPSAFSTIAADTRIEFVLARQDPSGNPTDGIVRIRGSRSNYDPISNSRIIRSEMHWDPNRYLNIYCLDLTSRFLGLASFPISNTPGNDFFPDFLILDGVRVDFRYFGVNLDDPNTSFDSYGRTLTHEVGHYLGLKHIWGSRGCGSDDFVDDTPPADDDNEDYGSPCTFPNPDDDEVCETPEMFQNYMDYTDDICMNLFTVGQSERMRGITENAIRRSTLLTSTGSEQPTIFDTDLEIQDILAPTRYSCDSMYTPKVVVRNIGLSQVEHFTASFEVDNMAVESIESQQVLDYLDSDTITFSRIKLDSGSTVEISITDLSNGLDERLANNARSILIGGTESIFPKYFENFESSQSLSVELASKNSGWGISNAARTSPFNRALKLNIFDDPSVAGDQLIFKTPVFDFSNVQAVELSFQYAYSGSSLDYEDGLVVKVSTDCGRTFSNIIYDDSGTSFRTTSTRTSDFTPQVPNDWDSVTLKVSQFTGGTDGIQFAFFGLNGGGNSLYIDDIAVNQVDDNARDVTFTNTSFPLLTCSNAVFLQTDIINIGFETVTDLSLKLTVGEVVDTIRIDALNVFAGRTAPFTRVLTVEDGSSQSFSLEVLEVNNGRDQSEGRNSITGSIANNRIFDSYPLSIDFEQENDWQALTYDTIQLWELDDDLGALRASSFQQDQLGLQSWFISPVLNTGGLDSVGLSFDISHASFPGRLDRLQVLLSEDCGSSYSNILFDAFSDELAISQSSSRWVPGTSDDWKNFEISLSEDQMLENNIRVAFVFTSANGNDLYIDNIQFR
ncbi:MAG: choice-of-anchor J domain-containing protein, partial [Bacteroidota bacterium]